jgi:hypothetical protein
MQMPKNDNNDNLENAEATQTPAEYTPEAVDEETEAPVTSIENARAKRRLGTGAIIGISAASVALLAGVFGSGIAVANVIGHAGGAPLGLAGQGPAQGHGDGDVDRHHGKPGQGPQGGMPGAPQGGLEADGSMPGNVPHEHDANGNDIIPEGYPTTAPSPATTN